MICHYTVKCWIMVEAKNKEEALDMVEEIIAGARGIKDAEEWNIEYDDVEEECFSLEEEK